MAHFKLLTDKNCGKKIMTRYTAQEDRKQQRTTSQHHLAELTTHNLTEYNDIHHN